MRVGPADIPPGQQPRDADDEDAQQDAKAQARHDDPSEQRLVERDEQDEADVDRQHYQRQRNRDAPAGGGEAYLFHRGGVPGRMGGKKKRPTPRCSCYAELGVGCEFEAAMVP